MSRQIVSLACQCTITFRMTATVVGSALVKAAKDHPMSFFKKLFGGGTQAPDGAPVKTTEHAGFTIEARPYKEGGQFQLAGIIAKEVGGVRKEYKFIRADRFTSKEEAADIALVKGKQIIDEQGEQIFRV